MSTPSLSEKLHAHVSRDFFRPLTRPSAAIYVDCAERLAIEAGEAGRLLHNEAVAIVREVLTAHPDVLLDEDEGSALRDIRQRAGQIFNRLCDAKWIEDQQLGLHDRWALVSPGLRPMLRLLRDLAEDEIAELKTFADTVRGVCETLERGGVLDTRLHEPDQLRATITDLNSRLENALIQLHGVEKIISIFDRKQRASETPAETLRLLYSEFGAGQHMVCYDALRRNGLLPRLSALRGKVADLRDDEQLKDRLAQAIAEHYGWSEDEAFDRANLALRNLESRLSAIRLVADAIDARMAGFNQLSQQRYRYQTELRGHRPEIIKAYCDAINEVHADTRLSQHKGDDPDFPVLVPELRFHYGSSSLARTRRVKAAADLSFGGNCDHEGDEQDALAALRERQRLALTPQRAARLIARLLPEMDATASSEAFTATNVDEMLDLLAIAESHPETGDAFEPEDDDNSRYEARRIELEEHDLERFTQEADDARREWEDRLQHQVLDVLKEKLDEAERTKRELNKAMDHEIGGWRYQLSMRKDLSHTAIWALVDKGLNPGLELMAAAAKEEIENAKAALMEAIENADEPRHQRALGYRYYHHWDIQAHPVGQGEGAAVSLTKSAKKQSGGENQAPFFVAMLAAFQRVYDLGDRNPKPNLGVIIMDEAFSKLSGDRIDACLELARNFGLQLVMAFPEDRLPTMIEHAETVLQCRVERAYDSSRNGAIADIENWVVKVDRDLLAEVLT